MTSELLIATALTFLPSFCDAEIRTVPSFGDDTMAVYNYDRDEIILSEELLYREIPHVMRHEAYGHCLEDQHDIKIPAMFGKPPFVSEYAAVDKYEDWAESVAFEVEGKSIGGRKARFIRRVLRRIANDTESR